MLTINTEYTGYEDFLNYVYNMQNTFIFPVPLLKSEYNTLGFSGSNKNTNLVYVFCGIETSTFFSSCQEYYSFPFYLDNFYFS